MTLAWMDLALYAGAVLVLFLTPGPVWMALAARAISGGFSAAWPLALGVVVGDAVWPFLAILGVSWIVSSIAGLMSALRIVAAAMFISMGVLALWRANKPLAADSRLTRPGQWAGFMAGLAVILGNPKAILFYMGLLPGFFDLTRVTLFDIASIVAISMVVPLAGNLVMALFIGRMRMLLSSPRALRRSNIAAGVALIVVGLIIPFT